MILAQVFSEEVVNELERLSLLEVRQSLKRLWVDQVGYRELERQARDLVGLDIPATCGTIDSSYELDLKVKWFHIFFGL